MIKNDFKENLVDEFLISMEEIKRNKGDESSLNLINESCKKHLGFNYSLLSALNFDDLVKILNHNRIDDYTKITLLGILMVEEASVLEKSNNTQFFNKYLGAFSILSKLAIEKKKTTFANYIDNLNYVIDKLLQFKLSLQTSKEIFSALEAINNFSKAEDLGFEILDEEDEFKNELRAFYNRLLTLNDDTLLKGNLTREEILESIEEL